MGLMSLMGGLGVVGYGFFHFPLVKVPSIKLVDTAPGLLAVEVDGRVGHGYGGRLGFAAVDTESTSAGSVEVGAALSVTNGASGEGGCLTF